MNALRKQVSLYTYLNQKINLTKPNLPNFLQNIMGNQFTAVAILHSKVFKAKEESKEAMRLISDPHIAPTC
jgi:hypothetical protein